MQLIKMARRDILCCILFCFFNISAQNNNIYFETVLKAFLEIWKSGANDLLPPISPIKGPDIEDVVYEATIVSVTFSASCITIIGLDTFVTSSIEVSETEDILIQVNVPTVIITADAYKLKGRAFYLYPVDCNGVLEVIFHDVDVTMDFRLAHNKTSVWVDYANMRIQPNEDVKVKMASCSYLVTSAINTEINNMFNTQQDMISEALHDQLVPIADELLAHTTIEELTTFIEDVVLDSL